MALRMLSALAVTAVALPALSAPAVADPVVNGEFPVPVGTNNQIGPGPDQNMWITLETGSGGDVARLGPDSTVTKYDLPGLDNPVGLTNADGKLWVTFSGGVASFSPDDPVGTTNVAPIAALTDARAMALGPDGNLWTGSNEKIFRIPTSAPNTATPFPSTGTKQFRWITAGSDGNLWVADGDLGQEHIVKVSTSGVGTPFSTPGGGPQGIAAGPNGQVAFSNPLANPQYVGRLSEPGQAQTTTTPLADPTGVTLGPDGAYWFAGFGSQTILRLTTDGTLTSLAMPPNSGPRQISAGPNNTVWVSLDIAEKVVRVTGVNPPPGPSPAPTPDPALTTTITKAPKKVVRTSKPRAKVKVRFAGTTGATFQCKLVKKPKKQAAVKWRACSSPKAYRLKKGKYTFLVRSKVGNGVDPTPARAKFRIKRR